MNETLLCAGHYSKHIMFTYVLNPEVQIGTEENKSGQLTSISDPAGEGSASMDTPQFGLQVPVLSLLLHKQSRLHGRRGTGQPSGVQLVLKSGHCLNLLDLL